MKLRGNRSNMKKSPGQLLHAVFSSSRALTTLSEDELDNLWRAAQVLQDQNTTQAFVIMIQSELQRRSADRAVRAAMSMSICVLVVSVLSALGTAVQVYKVFCP